MVKAVFFSATGTTKSVVTAVARELAGVIGAAYGEWDFTLPGARKEKLVFDGSDVAVFGTPVYAGRVPNVLLPYLGTMEGNGAIAVPVVVFGNRDFDDALIELRDILAGAGCRIAAAGAFVGEHAFSRKLACGRPDEKDMMMAGRFAGEVARKLERMAGGEDRPLYIPGVPAPYRGYYQPRDRKGTAIDIRKVKPQTSENCDGCALCARICPMGSIDREDVRTVTGICIKCGACVKRCPQGAKYYADEGYLYHKHELEEGYRCRAAVQWFV